MRLAQEPRPGHILQFLTGERKIVADYPGLLEKYVLPAVEEMERLEAEYKEQQKVQDGILLDVAESEMITAGKKIIQSMAQVEAILKGQNSKVAKAAGALGLNVYKKADKTHERMFWGGLDKMTSIPVRDIIKKDAKVADLYRKRVKESQKLITSLKPDGHKRLNKIVNKAIREKSVNLNKEIAPLIKKESLRTWETIDSRARLIANDQMHSYTAGLQEARTKQAGITHYFWRTSRDGRVRSEHADREGERFAYDDPPAGGHPGQPINCRCTAEPDLTTVAWMAEPDAKKKAEEPKPPAKKKAPPVAQLPEVSPPPLDVIEEEGREATYFGDKEIDGVRVPVRPPSPPSGMKSELRIYDNSVDERKKEAELSSQWDPDQLPLDQLSENFLEEKEKWRKNLSRDERNAISSFTGKKFSQIRAIQDSGYDLDEVIKNSPDVIPGKGKDRKKTEEWFVEMSKKARDIEKSHASAPVYEGRIFRGQGMHKDVIEKTLIPGTKIDNKSSSSWSYSEKVASEFGGGLGKSKVRFELDKSSSKTALVEDLSNYKHEHEVIMSRGKELEIESVTRIDVLDRGREKFYVEKVKQWEEVNKKVEERKRVLASEGITTKTKLKKDPELKALNKELKSKEKLKDSVAQGVWTSEYKVKLKEVPEKKTLPVTKPKKKVKPKKTKAQLKKEFEKAQKEWIDGLSKEEYESFELWSGDGYSDIRKLDQHPNYESWKKAMAKEAKDFGYEVMDDQEFRIRYDFANEAAKAIDEGFKKAPNFEGRVYRGLSLDKDTANRILVEGADFEDFSYSSWTKDQTVAEMFSEGDEVGNVEVILVKDHQGKGMVDISDISIAGLPGDDDTGEQEVLMDRKLLNKIKKVEKDIPTTFDGTIRYTVTVETSDPRTKKEVTSEMSKKEHELRDVINALEEAGLEEKDIIDMPEVVTLRNGIERLRSQLRRMK